MIQYTASAKGFPSKLREGGWMGERKKDTRMITSEKKNCTLYFPLFKDNLTIAGLLPYKANSLKQGCQMHLTLQDR